MSRWLRNILLLLAPVALAACSARGDATRPVPTTRVEAARQVLPAHDRRVVVMLPGRGDDLADLQRRGAAQIILSEWPDADVILAGLTLPYYSSGVATRRLHDEVIAPLKLQGYRHIWVAGISLGGLGALLYDQAYPGQLDGMLLLSPYLGDNAIQQEIRAAGGLSAWNPGPVQPMGPRTFQRELWRYLKQWAQDPARTQTVWLAYGTNERFRAGIELMSPTLPAEHVRMLPGRHNWALWNPALHQLLQAVQKGVRDNVGAAAACRAPAPWRNALSLPRPMHGIDPCPAPSAVAGSRESQPPAR